MEKLVRVLFAVLFLSLAAAAQIDPGSKGHGQPTFNCAINETYGDLDTGLVWKCYTPPTGWAPTPYFQPFGSVSPGSASLTTPNPQTFTGQLIIPDTVNIVRPAVDIRAFGAAMNGTTDDTVAINNAITFAHRSTLNCGLGSTPPTASCTGVVLIPNGATVASQIVMQNNVTLEGTGWNNSVIIQKAGANEHFIVGTNPATDQRFFIHDLFINGNAANQVGSFDCIHLDSTGSLGDSTRSPRHTLQNLFVANCKQDAISIQGDAGSEYAYNVKGMNSGRYGLNINVFDSHVDVGEFAQNGTAGIFTGTNGNGSIASVKSWGNGTGTTGSGYLINAPNYRLVNDEAQDNACNGFVFTSTNNETVAGIYSDGNGPVGGGSGCAGLILNNVTNSSFSGTIAGVVDAGTSDYGIVFQGTNTNNILDFSVNNDVIAQINGSVGTNSVRLNGNVYSSATFAYNNGSITRWFSDTGTTQQASFNGATGQSNVKQFNTANSGWSVFELGGPNNFDFSTNQNFMTLNASGAGYQMAEGCTGAGCPNTLPLKFTMPVQITQLTTTGHCVSIGTSNSPADAGYNCTQPHMFFGGFSGTNFASGATNYGGGPVLTLGVQTVSMTIHLDVTPLTCSTSAQVSLYDEGTIASPSTTVVSGSTITFANGKQDYQVAFSSTLTANHLYNWGTTVQQVGCGTQASSPHFQVEYTML